MRWLRKLVRRMVRRSGEVRVRAWGVPAELAFADVMPVRLSEQAALICHIALDDHAADEHSRKQHTSPGHHGAWSAHDDDPGSHQAHAGAGLRLIPLPGPWIRVLVPDDSVPLRYELRITRSVDREADLYYRHRGVRLVIAREDAPLLSGTLIDFVEDESHAGFCMHHPHRPTQQLGVILRDTLEV